MVTAAVCVAAVAASHGPSGTKQDLGARDDHQGGHERAGGRGQPLHPGQPALGQGRLQGEVRRHAPRRERWRPTKGRTRSRSSRRRTSRRRACRCSSTARSATKLAKAHGADPNSDAPPKFPYLENGVGQKTPPNVDRPGDSGVTGPGKKGESIDLTVTAPAGTKLYFMCLIHPWMQAEVDVT